MKLDREYGRLLFFIQIDCKDRDGYTNFVKGVLFLFLVVFLCIDVLLTLILFRPDSVLSTIQIGKSAKIHITSTIPGMGITISSSSFLEKKLEALGFWNDKRVRIYTPDKIDRATIKSLRIQIVDKPQSYGQLISSVSEDKILYSYGQTFDSINSEMVLYIHIDPSFQPKKSLDSKYSNVILFSLFDLVQPYPVSDYASYGQRALRFISDADGRYSNGNFVNITQRK